MTSSTKHVAATPHVVMIVANDVSADTRVQKMAGDLAAAGPRVTVLGLSSTGRREEFSIGEATAICLPRVEYRGPAFRDLPTRLGVEAPLHVLSRRIGGARDEFFMHQREVGAKIGWLRQDHLAKRQRLIADFQPSAAARRERWEKRLRRTKEIRSSVASWPAPIGIFARKAMSLLIRIYAYTSSRYSVAVNKGVLGRLKLEQITTRRAQKRMRSRLTRRREKYQKDVARWTKQMEDEADPANPPRPGSVDWRVELPELHDYDMTFATEIERQAPNVLHVHDVHLLGVGARTAARLSVGGQGPKLIYDAHEYVQGLSRYNKRTLAAWSSLEREYFHRADQVLTVSSPLAELLRRDYQMDSDPHVVMNIPTARDTGAESVRAAAGLPDRTPLVIYSGGMDRTRGVHTLVDAVGRLDGVHLALVAKAPSGYVGELIQIANEGGYGDRVHVVPFVDPHDVVSYLSTADVAVHPMVAGYMNHEIALPNKIFEYMHAGLPIVVSDCKAMSTLVDDLGIGEVFVSEDADSLSRSLEKMLADRDKYLESYRRQPDLLRRYSWAGQREILFDVYEQILPGLELQRDTEEPDATDDEPGQPVDRATPRVLIGPRNMAGQAWEWARALERHFEDVATTVVELQRPGRLEFPADRKVQGIEWRSLPWQLQWAREVAGLTHVLLESGSGILGKLNGGKLIDDLGFLRERGISVGVILHGSEVRDPRIHRTLVPESPFQPGSKLSTQLEESADRIREELARFEGPIFVSTLDLLDYYPDAIWLPQVVSLDRWQAAPISPPETRPLQVLFAPTNSTLKGGRYVEAVGGRLEEEGLIELKLVADVPPAQMPGLMAETDVLIDGLTLGLYGTTAVEGMASGRIVLANLSRVRDRQPEPPPIHHVTAEALEDTLRHIAKDPTEYVDLAKRGPAYVSKYHDGSYAASQLASFLELDPL